jgi:hypothetical protein
VGLSRQVFVSMHESTYSCFQREALAVLVAVLRLVSEFSHPAF